MSFVVVVADTDSASISLVSGASHETEEDAREALASWWMEQPAPVQAASRAYVLDLERLAPVLIVPIVEDSPEIVGFLPEDPTRQTREAYEEPLEPIVEEAVLVEDAAAEASVAEGDAGVSVADDTMPPPPPAVADPVEAVAVDEGAMDSFIGEADETETVLEELSDEAVLEEAAASLDTEQVDAAEALVDDAAEIVEAEAEQAVATEADPAEAVVEEVQAEWPGDTETVDPAPAEDDALDETPPDVVDEKTYYGSTGLAPVAGLAEEPELAEVVDVVDEEPEVAEVPVEADWQEETEADRELAEYAVVEGETPPAMSVEEPVESEPVPESADVAAEPAASWPWEIDGDSGGASGAVASEAVAPAPPSEVREPLGAIDAQADAQTASPVAGTATATAMDDAPTEPKAAPVEPVAGAYEPGNLDMETYTCDDCIYAGTCPKKDEETPATCGSFQWRAS